MNKVRMRLIGALLLAVSAISIAKAQFTPAIPPVKPVELHSAVCAADSNANCTSCVAYQILNTCYAENGGDSNMFFTSCTYAQDASSTCSEEQQFGQEINCGTSTSWDCNSQPCNFASCNCQSTGGTKGTGTIAIYPCTTS
jgi:hypothetical protein